MSETDTTRAWGRTGQVTLRKPSYADYQEILLQNEALGAVWQHPSGNWRGAPWFFSGSETSAKYVYTTKFYNSMDDAISDILFLAAHSVWEQEFCVTTKEELDALPDLTCVGNGNSAVYQKSQGLWYSPASLAGLSSRDLTDEPLIVLQQPH